MAWDEWEQLKQDAVQRHTTLTPLNHDGAGDGPAPSTSSITGGLKSAQREWSRAGAGVGGLRQGMRKTLSQLEDGQKGLGATLECLSAVAQKDVNDSWARYIKSVDERCGSVEEVLEKVGHDLLMTDDSVRSAFAAIAAKYADTPAVGGRDSGR
ncbi:hypothetical protein [Streptomyces nodosus]|uniref:hypothetical protein n=1 Tax=Streptomyces nodosus TaxID=40318 RepID=UPI00380D0F7E